MSAPSFSATRRLPQGGRIDRSQPLRFTFNGRSYQGFAGDTLASALLAAGQTLVARSWKYHRPRGLLAAGVEEPNALVQLFDAARTVPNVRMTEAALVDGLVARSIHASPSVEFDIGAVNNWVSRLIPAGFYYKTFMASQAAWHFFEKRIRAVSGLGRSPEVADPDRYDKRFSHADVLVVGAGLAGLSAALAAGRAGARVILCDEQSEAGGWLLSSDETVDGLAAPQWAERAMRELQGLPEVQVLTRTTAFGYQDHDLVTLMEKRADHLPPGQQPAYRERLWRVRARQVVLATGAHERPLVFARNDLPGVMLASAVSTYVRRYAVLPGHPALVVTNQDAGYDAAEQEIEASLPPGVSVIHVWNKADAAGPAETGQAGVLASTEGLQGLSFAATADVTARAEAPQDALRLSARTGQGLEVLRQALLRTAGWQAAPEGVFIARTRHVHALQRCAQHLGLAHTHLAEAAPSLDLLAEELRLAHQALGEITGVFTADDLLGEIFGKFCIGK